MQTIWKLSLLKIRNSKFAAFLLIMFMECFSYARPLRYFTASVEYPVSWCVFPFFMTNHIFLILFWFGIIYINSDVPFMQYFNMYHIIRTGRKQWIIGQISGIFTRCFLAVTLMAGGSILFLLPNVEFTNEWGKVIWTLASEGMPQDYNFNYNIYYEILTKYTPLQLLGLTIVILVLIAFFIGTLMLVLSLYVNRAMAVIISTAMCLMIYPVLNADIFTRSKIALFVPAVWGEIARIATPSLGYYWLPPIWYMVLTLTAGIIISVLLSIRRVKRMELNWVNEDC